MPRRPHGTEGGVGLATHDEIHRQHHGAGSVPRSGQRMRIEGGIGIDEMQPRRGRCGIDGVDVSDRMHPPQLVTGRGRCRVMQEAGIDAGGDHPVADRRQSLGALGVIGPHFMQHARRMRDEGGGHDRQTVNAIQ